MNKAEPKCGLFPWFIESGDHLIHKEDLATAKSLLPYGRVFKLVESTGEFLTLSYGETTIRVKPELFTAIHKPVRDIGERVDIVSKSRNVEFVIRDIYWHSKLQEPIYYVFADGKKISKRYFNSDFRS